MKTIFALLLLMVPAAAQAATDAQSCKTSLRHWNRCQVDSDCVVIADVCGSMIGATAAVHRDEAQSCTLALRAASKCASLQTPQDLPPMKAVCEKGACRAKVGTQ